MIPPEILAGLTAFCFACSSIFTKLGLKNSEPSMAVFITLGINVILLWILTISLLPLSLFISKGVLIFIAAGIVAPGSARLFSYKGIERVGVAIDTPIEAIAPFFSVLIAITFLGEDFSIWIILGTLLIVFGIIFITKNSQGGKAEGWEKRDLIFPFIAGLLYGLSPIIRKTGLNILNEPLIGATVVTTTALIYNVVIMIIRGKDIKGLIHKELINMEGLKFYALSGLFTSLSFIFNLKALSAGKVSILAPIMNTMPFFVLMLSPFLLKKMERVTTEIVAGTILIFTGITMIIS